MNIGRIIFSKVEKYAALFVVFSFVSCSTIHSSEESPRQKLSETLYNASQSRNYGYPILNACAEKNIDQVEQLLWQNGDLANMSSFNGCVHDSPLLIAICQESCELVELLLWYGANPNKYDAACSPLLLAVDQGNKDIVSTLLSFGAKPNQISRCKTPLELAIASNRYDLVEILIKHSFDRRLMGIENFPLMHERALRTLENNMRMKALLRHHGFALPKDLIAQQPVDDTVLAVVFDREHPVPLLNVQLDDVRSVCLPLPTEPFFNVYAPLKIRIAALLRFNIFTIFKPERMK